MSLAPLERFLGVDPRADARTLLGVAGGPVEPAAIDAALARRLAEVDDHPAARSADADRVRAQLRAAARALRGGDPPAAPVRPGSREATLNPRPPRPGPVPAAGSSARPPRPGAAPAPPARAAIRLTAFDQQVLAVLVASRGWNAEARSKLVSMAAAYGVSVQGLVKVIAGLSEYAKSGGPRLGMREITSGRARVDALPVAPAMRDGGGQLSATLMRTIGEQLDADRPGVRLRVGALAALVTILAGALLFSLVVPERREADEPRGPDVAAAGPVGPSPTVARPSADASRAAEPVLRARFDRIPSFTGNGLPAAAATAADAAPRAVDGLDTLARQLTIDPSLSIADTQRWREAHRIAGTGWILLDASTLAQVRQLVVDAIYVAADAPRVSDELLAMMVPSKPGADPLDLWRGAWNAGLLAEIAGSDTVPAAARQTARRQIEDALGRRLEPGELDFTTGADRWLRQAVPHMVSIIEFDDRWEDRWELWIAAQRALGDGPRFDDAMLDVLAAVLDGPADLARPGPSADLMGRMVLLIDFSRRPSARERVLAWFDDPAVSVSDLWVLTSLLSLHDRTPWFDEQLVLPVDADPPMRRRIASLLDDRWAAVLGPEDVEAPAEGRGVVVDRVVLAAWRDTASRLEARLASRGGGVVELAAAARLNTAASMLASGRPGDVRFHLEEAEALLSGEPLAFGPAVEPGQPIGTDGVWAEAYDQAGRNLEQRLALLRSLRSSAGTDLGPTDAGVLVAEALRGSPTEVRSLAQSVVLELFEHGPNVAAALVDHLPDAQQNDVVSELIAQFTRRALPPVRDETWPVAARHAAASHAVALRRSGGPATDALAEIIARAYAARLTASGRAPGATGAPLAAPDVLAGELALLRQRQASGVMTQVHVPGDLPSLRHRSTIRQRLADGPIQSFVAAQLSLLELLAHQTVAEQPRLADDVRELLAGAQQRRDQMAHVVEQAVDAERTMSDLWRLRLVSSDEVAP